jgi:hypothetical protein
MITKDELIKKIDEAIITEENAVMLYNQHLKTILPWSGLSKENQSMIITDLNTLSNESGEHKKILSLLKNKIEKGDNNVF